MEETKEKVYFYEQPKVLKEIDRAIDILEHKEGDRISRSSFIRRAIRHMLDEILNRG